MRPQIILRWSTAPESSHRQSIHHRSNGPHQQEANKSRCSAGNGTKAEHEAHPRSSSNAELSTRAIPLNIGCKSRTVCCYVMSSLSPFPIEEKAAFHQLGSRKWLLDRCFRMGAADHWRRFLCVEGQPEKRATGSVPRPELPFDTVMVG